MKNFFGHKNYILPFQGANRYYRQSSQGVAIGLKYKWFSTIPNAPKGHYNPTLVEMQAALPIRNKMKDSVLNNNEKLSPLVREIGWTNTVLTDNAPKGHYNPTQWQRLGVAITNTNDDENE